MSASYPAPPLLCTAASHLVPPPEHNVWVKSVTLVRNGVVLEPLTKEHAAGLALAAADGQLWNLRVSTVPEPGKELDYILMGLNMQDMGLRQPFAVLDEATGRVLGTTSYHDIVPGIRRLEIGFTWYAQSVQRTHVNSTCKMLLMEHAFETLHARVLGWRTDNFNFASQRAIERLGAKKDGVIRGHLMRRDGTIRDTVMYSMTAGEWPEAKAQLQYMINRHDQGGHCKIEV